jgi:hypothetical protein
MGDRREEVGKGVISQRGAEFRRVKIFFEDPLRSWRLSEKTNLSLAEIAKTAEKRFLI